MKQRRVLNLVIVLAAAFTAPSANGDTGDIAIFTETTAGESIAVGASLDLNWDTEYRNDGTAFGYTLNGAAIDLNESGHYMAIYNSRFNSSGGSERREIQSQLILDAGGTPDPLSIGWSQAYIRKQNGQDEAITAGGGIFELSAASTLSLRSTRTDNEANALARVGSASGIQLLKLDENWDYLRLTRAANQAGPTNTSWVDVAYDTQDELDAGSFAHTAGNGDITLKTPGHYIVFANTYNDMTTHDDTRTLATQRLTLDGA